MRVAYVILAYHKPAQLGRLVRRLACDQAGFFVHVDRRAPISPFRAALAAQGSPPVTFLPREVSRWNSLGCVRATLNGMRAVLASREPYDRLVFLSGQDYPLRSSPEMLAFYAANRSQSHLGYYRLPCEKFHAGGMYRLDRFSFRLGGRWLVCPPLEDPGSLPRKLALLLARLYFPRRRVLPPYAAPYAGDYWFDLTPEAAGYLLEIVDRHPDYLRFHRHTHIPEESFFHCLLLAAPEKALRGTLVNSCPRYYKSMPRGIPHPKVLTTEDLDDLRSTDKLFARKFDTEVDERVLDLLDQAACAVTPRAESR